MIPDPFVVAAGATISDVAALMHAKNISVVPVIDNPKDRRFLGMMWDRDIVVGCVALEHDPRECPVEQHMRTNVAVVTLETELAGYKLARQADPQDQHVRSTIVVVDGNKKVVGFIPHPEAIRGIVMA
jgi:predicted transcriptional regulator